MYKGGNTIHTYLHKFAVNSSRMFLNTGFSLPWIITNGQKQARELEQLAVDLLAWIGAHTDYDTNFDPPKIIMLSGYTLMLRHCWPDLRKFRASKHVHAFYYTPTRTIFMLRFSDEDPCFWASVLVHELTHYVQDMNNTLNPQPDAKSEAEAELLDSWFYRQCQRELVMTSSSSSAVKPTGSGSNRMHAGEWQRIRHLAGVLAAAPAKSGFRVWFNFLGSENQCAGNSIGDQKTDR